MAEVPDPEEYDTFEDWLADAVESEQLDEDMMEKIVTKVEESPWSK